MKEWWTAGSLWDPGLRLRLCRGVYGRRAFWLAPKSTRIIFPWNMILTSGRMRDAFTCLRVSFWRTGNPVFFRKHDNGERTVGQ